MSRGSRVVDRVRKEQIAHLELEELGVRRRRIGAELIKLAKDTARVIKKHRGVVPMTEMAKLVGLDRTTLYHNYGDYDA